MTRHLLVAIGWGVLGLLWISVVLLALREDLAEDYLKHRLAQAGYPDVRLQVTRLGLNGARIRALSLGRKNFDLEVRRLDIDYAFPAIVRGRLEGLELAGVRVRLDLTRSQWPASILPFKGGEGRGLTRLPIQLRNARVAARTDRGWIEANLEGWFEPEAREGRLEAEVREGAEIGEGEPAKLGSLVVEWIGRGEGETGHLDFRAEGNLAAKTWAVLGVPGRQGRVAAMGLFHGRLPSSLPKTGGAAGLLRLLSDSDLEGTMEFKLAGGGYGEGGNGIEARLELGLRTEGRALELHLQGPARLLVDKRDSEALTAWGLPRALATQLIDLRELRLASSGSSRLLKATIQDGQLVVEGKGTLQMEGSAGERLQADLKGALRLRSDWGLIGFEADSVNLAAAGLKLLGDSVDSARFTGTLAGSSGEVTGQGALRLRMARLSSPWGLWRDLDCRLPLEGSWQVAGPLQARLRGAKGRLSVRPPKGASLAAQSPLRMALERGQLRWSPAGEMALSLRALPEPIGLSLTPEERGPFEAVLRPGPFRIKAAQGPGQAPHGNLLVGESAVVFPAWGVEAEGLTAKATGKEDRARIRLDLGRLHSTAQPPWFAPLTGKVDFWARRGAAIASGKMGLPGRDPLLDLQARIWPSNGSSNWELALNTSEVAFREAELQPRHLSPRLKDLQEVQGALSAEARVAPQGKRAQIRLQELSFQLPSIRFENLSGSLTLDRLLPPTTVPGQRLSARRIVVGLLPLTEAQARYTLESGSGALPTLRIQYAQAGLFGGQIRLADERLDLGATEPKVTLRIRDLDLGALFERVGVEGLGGSGRLSGKIPLKLAGGKVRIDGGRLRANGAGVLRYRSQAAKQALGQRGKQLQLVLRVLEDFHYDKLALSLRHPTDGNFRMRLSTLGRNPDVLGGTPFQINVNVRGEVGPWARSLLQGGKLPEELLKRALEIQRP